jgi:Ca2+-binding RTX toxin-like protein
MVIKIQQPLPVGPTGLQWQGTLGNDLFDFEPISRGNDQLLGQDGKDTLYGHGGDDVLEGGAGDDKLYGGSGDDLIYGDQGNDEIFGGAGNDSIYGGLGKDKITGGDGKDLIYGGLGNDSIFGGAGKDKLYGEAGKDVLDGGTGNDTLDGGAGDDTLVDSKGNDVMVGGAGKDLFVFTKANSLQASTIEKTPVLDALGRPTGSYLSHKVTNVDVIKDFDVNQDVIELKFGINKNIAYDDFEYLMTRGDNAAFFQLGADTYIGAKNLGFGLGDMNGANSEAYIVLKNVNIDDLGEANFIFS